ncbi:flavodoxin family protein [Roseateles sp. BYS180W]|uniref:Flavoprotein WrbA n=1 Tax=Roseateles rivi TaxID=3299028 RepID=A0ABW7FST1_9BURK
MAALLECEGAAALAVVYFSAGGRTAELAQVLAQAFTQAAAPLTTPTSKQWRARCVPIEGADIHAGRYRNEAALAVVDQAAAVVLASPTYMGGPAAQFKAWADASSERWAARAWAGKWAAGLTTGSSPGGELTCTLQYFQTFAAQHGMLWVPMSALRREGSKGHNRLGSGLGVAAWSDAAQAHPADLRSAALMGQQLAAQLNQRSCRFTYTLPD